MFTMSGSVIFAAGSGDFALLRLRHSPLQQEKAWLVREALPSERSAQSFALDNTGLGPARGLQEWLRGTRRLPPPC